MIWIQDLKTNLVVETVNEFSDIPTNRWPSPSQSSWTNRSDKVLWRNYVWEIHSISIINQSTNESLILQSSIGITSCCLHLNQLSHELDRSFFQPWTIVCQIYQSSIINHQASIIHHWRLIIKHVQPLNHDRSVNHVAENQSIEQPMTSPRINQSISQSIKPVDGVIQRFQVVHSFTSIISTSGLWFTVPHLHSFYKGGSMRSMWLQT